MFSSQDSQTLQSHFDPQDQAEPSRVTSTIAESTMSIFEKQDPNNISKAGSVDQGNMDEIEKSKTSWRFLGAFGCLCVLNLVCAVDATILAVALPIISSSLNGTAIEAFWAGTSFLLTSTVFQPSWASFSHIMGRKPVLLVSLVIFTVGTIIASIANESATLLVGRSVQGIGGGGIVALTYVIVTDLVTLRERGKWFALIALQWAIGSVTGPVIGGACSEKTNWRWIFWLNLPFCLIAFVAIPICLRLHHKTGSILEKLKRFDWIGSFLFVASLTSFLIPITWGGIQFEWSSWHTLVPLILGFFGLVGFFVYSRYVSAEPLIRGSIFLTSTAKVGYFGTTIHGIITWSFLYYLPLYYEVAKDFGATEAGVAMFPLTFTTAPAAVIVGLVIAKTGKYRPSVWIGWFLTTFGAGLVILLKESSTTVQWIFLTLVIGTGAGILFSAQSFAVQASASNADLPFAGAMYSFFRALGQTFGVAVGGVIFQNRLKLALTSSSNPLLAANADNWARDASSLVEIIKKLPDTTVKQELITAYVDSLRVIWIVMCALAAVSFVLSMIYTKDISLERPLETEQGFRHKRSSTPDAENAVAREL